MQQLLHTHTTMVRVSSSPAIINLSGFITLSTWKAISIKTTFTGAKCFVNNAALFIHSMEQQKRTAARAYQPANAKASTNLQAIADLRDLTNRGRVTVDIDAEPTRSSLPQRKAHKHIQLHYTLSQSADEGPDPVKGSGYSADESAASPEAQTKQHQCGDDDSRRPSLSNLVGQSDQQARHQAFPVLPVRSRTVVMVIAFHENLLFSCNQSLCLLAQ